MSLNGSSSNYARIVETNISSDLALDDDYIFELNCHAPRNNIMDYFYFVDENGDLTKTVKGQVEILLSPVDGIFQSIPNGIFEAHTAADENWQKPNGFGKAIAIKIRLVCILGASGFRFNITQSVD